MMLTRYYYYTYTTGLNHGFNIVAYQGELNVAREIERVTKENKDTTSLITSWREISALQYTELEEYIDKVKAEKEAKKSRKPPARILKLVPKEGA